MQSDVHNVMGYIPESPSQHKQVAQHQTEAETEVQPVQQKSPMTPIASNERIEVLDVIRGFALISIFLMNIEFFNRSTYEIGEGIPHGLAGLNWLAAVGIQHFVTGKFWTMFSVLFGMGFAVMLTRAQASGSEFLKPYIRRVAALAQRRPGAVGQPLHPASRPRLRRPALGARPAPCHGERRGQQLRAGRRGAARLNR